MIEVAWRFGYGDGSGVPRVPEVDGLELLKFAKRQNPNGDVIMHSAQLSQGTIARAIEGGATACLPKSADCEQLVLVLEQAYQRAVQRKGQLRTWRA